MSSTQLALCDVRGPLNNLLDNLSGDDGEEWLCALKKMLRRENPWPGAASHPGHSWRQEDNVIYLTVTSDSTTGPQWIERLGQKGFQLSKSAKDVLNSPDFTPTNGVEYRIAVLKGLLFEDRSRITSNIRVEAKRRGLIDPHPEVACLIRKMFSDKELEAMGLEWIVTMHEPIKDSGGSPDLLIAGRGGDGYWLGAVCGKPDVGWLRDRGFAFTLPQVSPES